MKRKLMKINDKIKIANHTKSLVQNILLLLIPKEKHCTVARMCKLSRGELKFGHSGGWKSIKPDQSDICRYVYMLFNVLQLSS